jgi:predicted SAM-dependent methyltransferase
MKKLTTLNLGCGHDYIKGATNLDISANVGADIVCDITGGIPFENNSFDIIIVNNVLTQIQLPKRFIFVMNELWRVSRGEVQIRVPNAKHICSWQDPMDVRRFTDQTFTYMEGGHRRYEQYGKHYGFRPWKVKLISDNGRQMKFKLKPIK